MLHSFIVRKDVNCISPQVYIACYRVHLDYSLMNELCLTPFTTAMDLTQKMA